MTQRYQRVKGKLSENRLEKLDDRICSDQHLRLVAEKVRNWEEKADLLDLSQQDLSDLKGKYSDNPYNLR